MGGIDDGGFNQLAWEALERARDELGVEVYWLSADSAADFGPNIDQHVTDGADLVVTVGFTLAEATSSAAATYPDTDFAIVDAVFEPALANVLGTTFQTDQSSFLAGYLAAGMSTSGVVGTYGGMDIPPVNQFMVGYADGVAHYNTVHSTAVTVVGTDVYINDFSNPTVGHNATSDLITQGADIVFPVAGGAGKGSLTAANENPGTLVIGVDLDWCLVEASSCGLILTSVVKDVEGTVYQAVESSVAGSFSGGTWTGDLANGGTDLAPFHDRDGDVPKALKGELDAIRAELIAGTLTTSW